MKANIAIQRFDYPKSFSGSRISRGLGYCRANKYGEEFGKYKDEFNPIIIKKN